jgi:site-specific recombinase XerD
MKHLTKDELRRLLTVARSHSERDWLMILVAYWHGMRASEVVSLTSGDIGHGEIVVRRLKGSDTTTQPLIYSTDHLFNEKEALETLSITGRLFPVCRKVFWEIVQKHGKEAGINPAKCHPHILKHSIAMHGIKKAGIENMRRHLGHRSMSSTGAYLVVDDETATKAVAAAVSL